MGEGTRAGATTARLAAPRSGCTDFPFMSRLRSPGRAVETTSDDRAGGLYDAGGLKLYSLKPPESPLCYCASRPDVSSDRVVLHTKTTSASSDPHLRPVMLCSRFR